MKRNWFNVLKVLTVSLLLLGLAGAATAQEPGPQGNLSATTGGSLNPQNVQTALGTGFTYQGQLKNASGPVTGNCDFQFGLWDSLSNATGQVGTTQTKTNVSVTAGLFTIPNLDFGSAAFTGDARWLQTAVKCTGDSNFNTLTPRQALTAAPYALSLRPGAIVSGTIANGSALTAQQADTSGELGFRACQNFVCFAYGVRGVSTSSSGIGVYGRSIATGVLAEATGEYGTGVQAKADGANGRGISAQADEANGTGIFVTAIGANGTGIEADGAAVGAKVTSSADFGIGVDARANGKISKGIYGFGKYYGVEGHGAQAGVYGEGLVAGVEASSSTSDGYGVYATAKNGTGVYGRSDKAGSGEIPAGGGSGVLGENNSLAGIGVQGKTSGAYGYGVYGVANSSDGNGGYFLNTAGGVALRVDGTASAMVVQITGGSDLAEKFDVESNSVEPGTLMVIDEEHAGKLKPSQKAYDTRVAGVVSGAGGVQPGLTLQQQGVIEGDTSVAIAGRVYVRAEALSAPIKPGDLLTSSSIPGHAMKATDREQAQGAIIGKAMSALQEGTGLVLVLVNLQ